MYRQYTPTLKSTIGNDLTGTIQGGDQNESHASGVFSFMEKTQSAISTNGDSVMFYLDKVRFSGSSGTCSLLQLKPRGIKGGNHSHSRGTIGNDLTGELEFVATKGSATGVFGNSSNRGSVWHDGGGATPKIVRFSGSSG